MYGVAGQRRVPDEFLRNLLVRSIPLDGQRRIVKFLDIETARMDQMVDLQFQFLEKLRERESAQLDLEIQRMMTEWGSIPFRRFIWGVDQGVSPQCDAIPAGDHEWGVLKVSSLRPGVFLPEENKRLPNSISPDTSNEVREGDLLVVRANTPQLVGSTAAVPRIRRKLLLSDKIFRVRLLSGVSPEFIAAVARGKRVRDLCAAVSNGASQSMANIRFEEVKAWPIPAVTSDVQDAFVKRVSDERARLNALQSRIERQFALLGERRQALITAAVTGQFDVSSASGRNVTDGVGV
ncbi:hypothetical protein GCM10027160_09610 [Streptomyces calidiresistens]